VLVSFFLEKHYVPHSAVLSFTNMLRLCQIIPMLWVKVVAIFGVINRVPATTHAHNVFCYSAVAHILTLSVNLAFRPKPGFKNKCRTRAGFRLQNEALLQLYVCLYARAIKGRLKAYVLHPPTVKID